MTSDSRDPSGARLLSRGAFALIVAYLVAAASLSAQAHFTMEIKLEDGEPQLSDPPSTLTGEAPVVATSGVVLEINCSADADCNQVDATVGTEGTEMQPVVPQPRTRATATITVPDTQMDEAEPTLVVLRYGGEDLRRFKFTRARAAVAGRGTAGSANGENTLATLLATDCRRALRGRITVYDRRNNRARFVVTPRGKVLLRPSQHVDENDAVSVIVVADSVLLPLMRVERKSPIRDLEQVSILGEGERVARFAGPLGAPSCAQDTSEVGDFAPGRGVVELRALRPGREDEQVTGSFEFNVNRLYIGMFSLGAVLTGLEDPQFGLAFNGQDSVIVLREDASSRILYTIMFTPFLWGRRDSEKGAAQWWHHLNPAFGIVLNDVAENAIAGLTIDLGTLFLIHGGVHGGRVRRLSEDTPFRLGNAFPGPASALPVEKGWKYDVFAGVTVDLRAAVRLLRIVVSGTT